MHVVILAAGRGSRLGPLTADRPKPALVVAGRPLLAWSIAFARRAGAARITVVTGYRADVTAAIARSEGADVTHNPRHELGNVVSLRAVALGGPTLVMNADHIYAPRLTVARDAPAAFVDRTRPRGPDDMKVRIEGDRVVEAGKGLDPSDAAYIGLTFVPDASISAYRSALAALAEDQPIEAALPALRPLAADATGLPWVEVDDAADLARAEAVLAAERWYD